MFQNNCHGVNVKTPQRCARFKKTPYVIKSLNLLICILFTMNFLTSQSVVWFLSPLKKHPTLRMKFKTTVNLFWYLILDSNQYRFHKSGSRATLLPSEERIAFILSGLNKSKSYKYKKLIPLCKYPVLLFFCLKYCCHLFLYSNNNFYTKT